MADEQPNIVLIMVDQMRADCLGIAGHPVVRTPHLDALAATGIRFDRAYSACPVCVPARRTLMSGQRPQTHGVLANKHVPLQGPTLAGELAAAGYQTHLIGKLHLHPQRKRYGFQSADWADAPTSRYDNDYLRFLRREGGHISDLPELHGANMNSWLGREWPLDDRLHFSHWCADCAIDYLERRDPTLPFFLNVSFFHPHQPLTPPRAVYERYLAQQMPEPCVGDWARVFNEPQRGLATDAWRVCLGSEEMQQMRAAYYALITDIDDQIGRLIQRLPANTWIVFVADHGEMLGDHQWTRKRNAFEGSARVPLIVRPPAEATIACERGMVRREPVELMDIMPTLLDVASREIPKTVEGRSMVRLLGTDDADWREYLHGECCLVPTLNSGMQFLTDGQRKYIWYPGRGEEQFFDLQQDPQEMHNRIDDAIASGEVELWRQRLVETLRDRPEGFTDGHTLQKLAGPTPAIIT